MLRDIPSPELLRKLLRYEPETGKFFWLERTAEFFKDTGHGGPDGEAARWNARFAGREAFVHDLNGYKTGRVFGIRIRAHRAAWAMQTGSWPEEDIDHINCHRADNRWLNLRGATRAQNTQNRGKMRNNKSGFKGVQWRESKKMWTATISAKLGWFNSAEEAASAYARASGILHGEFGRTE